MVGLMSVWFTVSVSLLYVEGCNLQYWRPNSHWWENYLMASKILWQEKFPKKDSVSWTFLVVSVWRLYSFLSSRLLLEMKYFWVTIEWSHGFALPSPVLRNWWLALKTCALCGKRSPCELRPLSSEMVHTRDWQETSAAGLWNWSVYLLAEV